MNEKIKIIFAYLQIVTYEHEHRVCIIDNLGIADEWRED